MKLATYKDGSRDGQLVVVSRDLSTAHYATGVAQKLQQVLDDWNFLAPQLQDLSVALNSGNRANWVSPSMPTPSEPCPAGGSTRGVMVTVTHSWPSRSSVTSVGLPALS